MRNFGTYFDTANKRLWTEMASSRGTGLILRSIKVDYKFVSYVRQFTVGVSKQMISLTESRM